MKIQTFTVVAGGTACNARCPYCVARMTGAMGVPKAAPEVNWRNFDIACRLADKAGVSTALITSKGEATLFPEQLSEFVKKLGKYNFPLIELQTNGIAIADNPGKFDSYLKQWYENGLTTVAISHAHYEPEMNRQIYTPGREKYIDLPALIQNLHNHKLSVRLTTILANGFIDSSGKLEKLLSFAKENNVEQLSVKVMVKPQKSIDPEVFKWETEHHLLDEQIKDIRGYLCAKGSKVMTLAHGAAVYDVNGQNCSLTDPTTDCFTEAPGKDEIRQLIFFPDGAIRTDWRYEGARLL